MHILPEDSQAVAASPKHYPIVVIRVFQISRRERMISNNDEVLIATQCLMVGTLCNHR